MRTTMRVGILVLGLLSLVVFLQVVAATEQGGLSAKGEIVRGETGKTLDQYLTRLEKFGFSGAAIASKDGEIILSKGYGWANREKKIPFTAETVNSIGSITKQFTAAAILKLEMMGNLHVEDSISKYFPNVPADKTGITIHHLLTHTAGFRGDFGGRDSDAIGRDALVQTVLAAPLEAKPGERFEYSNEGYSLLGAIVEIASRQTYEKFLREQIFLPAGMKDTGYVLPNYAAERIARGYAEAGPWGTIREKGWKEDGPGWYLKANGGIYSTVGDMYRWAVALEGAKILSAAAREKYQKGYVAEGPMGMSHYAYGWSVQTTPRKTKLVTHNGGNGVFFADFLRFVDEGTTLFIFSNSTEQPATEVSTPMARALFGEDFRMPPAVVSLSAAELARLAGTYALETGEKVEVTAAEGRVKVAAGGVAFALVNGLAPAGSARFAELEKRTKEAVEASAMGEYALLKAAFGGDMPVERIREQESGMWQRRRERFGEFRRAAILGTARRGPGIAVHVRMQFERGTQVMRYVWDNGQLMGVRVLDQIPEVTFFPTSATEFTTFNVRQPSVQLKFAVDEKGAANSVRVVGEDGEVVAKKSSNL